LIAAGLTLQALLVAFVLLYVNVPIGYDVPFGLSRGSPALFRTLWPYPSLSIEPGAFRNLATVIIVALWAVYLAAWIIVRRSMPISRRRQMVLGISAFTVLYHVVLALAMPPVLSSDIYHYALFGRMVALYGLNPYVLPGTVVSGDPVWPWVFWRDVTTHYGPTWTLISAAAAALSDRSVLLTVLTFKGVAALFNLANCLLVFQLARRLTGGDGVAALLLYAWNPLILIEVAGSGHNDAVMMTFALLGLLLAARGRLLFGLTALLLSVMVKYLTALLAVFFVMHCLARAGSWRQRATLAGRMAAVSSLVVGALYLPFWAGPSTLERLGTVGAPFKSFVRYLLREWLAKMLAVGDDISVARAAAEPYVAWGLYLGFGLLVLALAMAVAARGSGWLRVLNVWGVASLAFVMLVYGWNLPWYLIPTLATAGVAVQTRASMRLLGMTHTLGLLLMLLYTIPLAVSESR
jgi:alpha-1,6-mannosyltransferase